ncbi:MAG: TOBE domain-containing protein [Janthinobacterium lividum]
MRPEQLRLTSGGRGGVGGTVQAVRFLGSYYELEVHLPTGPVRVRAAEAAFALGATVRVHAAPGAGWLIEVPMEG